MEFEDIKEQVSILLDLTNRKQALKILGEILDEYYDLSVASNMVKADCDSSLNKMMFEECHYSEGNEEAGFIRLKDILDAVEEIVNCDNYNRVENISFEYFVRPETDEESEIEERHDSGVEWWVADEKIDIDKAYIQFDGS